MKKEIFDSKPKRNHFAKSPELSIQSRRMSHFLRDKLFSRFYFSFLEGNFTDIITGSCYERRSPKCKKHSQVVSLFCAFGIWERNCTAFNIDEIDYRCQFHQRFCARVFCMNVVSASFLVTCTVEKAAEMTFVRKIRTFTVDEIDTYK